ncbi:VOC family protein [Candidatus Parcubacteria bacterium]|nr:VOC family protein [Candidatus Parcubacteria bacterium]
MKTWLYHLQVNVSDTKVSFPFYKDFFSNLGYRIMEEGDDHLGITNGTTDFWIIQTEAEYKSHGFHRKNTGLNHLSFMVESKEAVDVFHKGFLESRKIPTLYQTPRLFPEYGEGYYAVFFEDPDRMKLEVTYKP